MMLEPSKELSETELMDCVKNQIAVEIWFADGVEEEPDYVGPIERFDEYCIKTRTDYYVRSQCVICLEDENGANVRSS